MSGSAIILQGCVQETALMPLGYVVFRLTPILRIIQFHNLNNAVTTHSILLLLLSQDQWQGIRGQENNLRQGSSEQKTLWQEDALISQDSKGHIRQ